MSIAEKFEVIADAVYDKGKQDEWSDFWDVYQVEGRRTHYGSAFGVYTTSHNTYWNDQIYRPKYSMQPTNMERMYQAAKMTDLVTIHQQLGITLDTSNCTNFTSCFANSPLTHIPEISAVKCNSTSFSNVFAGSKSITTIDKIILPETGNIQFSTTFKNCIALENITFEGAIGNNISFAESPLSTASIVNIIEHLSNSQSATLTLKKTAKESMSFPYTSPQTNITYNSWDELVATKLNWTISLV